MAWTAPPVERNEPPRIAAERESLQAWLDYHRETLRWKCAGLTGEQLAQRPLPPSTLSLLGLVRHMTEVERWWFRRHAAGADLAPLYYSDANPDGDFDDLVAADAEADLARFVDEVAAADAGVRALPLDHVVPSLGDHPERTRDLRWIYVHMIEEYARHNGHADLLREAVDGSTGD